jgi:hypothetical protein
MAPLNYAIIDGLITVWPGLGQTEFIGGDNSGGNIRILGGNMIRTATLITILAMALTVTGQPIVQDLDGQPLAGARLSIHGSGFGENQILSFAEGDSLIGGDSPARIFLSNSATYPDSLSTILKIQPPLAWGPSRIDFQFDPGGFQPGESAYLYVVDSRGGYNPKGFLLTIGEITKGPGIPGTPTVVQ